MIVVVTGANGFIGRSACEVLESSGHDVRRVVRSSSTAGVAQYAVGDIAGAVDWEPVLRGADAILHLAARAHVLVDRDPAAAEDAFLRSNVNATKHLLQAAGHCRVRRFVLLSSVGVNGAMTSDVPFREIDDPQPAEPYARSKLRAEVLVRDIAEQQRIESVIVRPPLVYGPGAKGNLLRMLQLARYGIPLPLASICNRRSLVGLRNLCEALRLCVERPAAAGETFLIAEPAVYSTPEIFSALYAAMRMRSRLFPCPETMLRLMTRFLGMQRQFDKLCSSLEVDASKARGTLGWNPAVPFHDEIASTVAWFENSHAADRRGIH